MIGQPSIPLETRYHRLEAANRWFIGIAVVAIVALIAVGAWLAIDRFGQTEAERTVTELTTVWAGGEADQLADVYAEDAVLISGSYQYRGLEEIQAVIPDMSSAGFTPEIAGPMVEYGDAIAAPIHFTWDDGSEDDALSIFRLNDEGLVVYHEDFPVRAPED
jgi:hypothetical protein